MTLTAHTRWHEIARAATGRGERVVLVIVATTAGSTPRESGAAMVVTREGIAGTIGGGHLEYEASRMALEALAQDAPPAQWLVRFPLAARLGQCCGGVATLSFATLAGSALSWLDVVSACAHADTACIVVSRVESGDLAGGRLVITADDAQGTLGAPGLDSVAVTEARVRLGAQPGFQLGSQLGSQIREPRTGTSVLTVDGVTLLMHVVRPSPFAIRVFGNGHIGRALVQVLGALPADVRWIDARVHDFPARVPENVEVVVTDDPAAEVVNAPRGAFVVVMTHSHPLDFDIIETALERDDWRYLGLIGSKSKRVQFERRLVARGALPATLFRLTCPIGSGALQSKEPGVIAVAVAAELLAVRGSEEGARIRGQTPFAPTRLGRAWPVR